MARVVHNDPERALACPSCDSAGQVYERESGSNAYVGDPDDRYSCGACRATFNHPIDRPAYHVTLRASDEELLADVERACDEVDRGVSMSEYQELGTYSPSTVRDRIGWNEAIRRVGYEPRPKTGGNCEMRTEFGRLMEELSPEDVGLSPIGERPGAAR